MLQVFKDAEKIAKKEGRLEEQRKIVANMLKDNMDIAQIVKLTELSEEEILKLKAELEAKKE